MFGLRSCIAIASDVGRRVLQSPSFHGLSAQCVHIRAGMEIPDNKPLQFALQRIQGVGRARARQLLAQLNMTNKLAKELTRREVLALGDELDKYILGRELENLVGKDIQKMKAMMCYKGIRHTDKLPCRGQRTSTNGRTRKGSTRIAMSSSAKVKNK